MIRYSKTNRKGVTIIYTPKRWAIIGVIVTFLFFALIVYKIIEDPRRVEGDKLPIALLFILDTACLFKMFLDLFIGGNKRIRKRNGKVATRERNPWSLLMTAFSIFLLFCADVADDITEMLIILAIGLGLLVFSIMEYIGSWEYEGKEQEEEEIEWELDKRYGSSLKSNLVYKPIHRATNLKSILLIAGSAGFVFIGFCILGLAIDMFNQMVAEPDISMIKYLINSIHYWIGGILAILFFGWCMVMSICGFFKYMKQRFVRTER